MTPRNERTNLPWTPLTTQALSGKVQGCYYDVLDHFLENSEIVESIRQGFYSCGIMGRLRPARTTSDARIGEILELIAKTTNQTVENEFTGARGDKNIFLHEKFHQSLPLSHPLKQFLDTLTDTVHSQLDGIIEFTSSVSVQLAVYPGDNVSGYPRHCDRKTCGISSSEAPVGERILTALYYLTPYDWCHNEDGGCLRVFHHDGSHLDICPYPNRLVIFRSDQVEHQVLPSKRRDRMAITVWFYGKVRQQQQQQIEDSRPSLKSFLPTLNHVGGNATVTTSDPPQPLLRRGNADSRSTIFVSIPSFRDSETGPTIQSLLATAQYPERIRIGLVLQVDSDEDQGILASISQSHNIRTLILHSRDAQGPCYARYLCQRLWRDEDFALQIDSHMRFRRNWDTYLISMLPSGKTMLTTYPVGYQLPNKIPSEVRGTLLVPWKFDQGMMRQRGRLLAPRQEPIPCRLYAAGFNFSRASTLQDCPYPDLPHVFFGEELFMAARLYQAGYQLFAPPETVVYHLWSRAHRPTASPTVDEAVRQKSLAKVIKTLDSLDEGFWKCIFVDWKGQTLLEGCDLGGLSPDDFAAANDPSLEVSESTKELVQKVASLDGNAQDLIASFLRQM